MPKLTFTPNVPVQVALKFPDGKMVEGQFGDQIYYTLTSGDCMYLSLEAGAKINALELRRNEPFWICKRWSGKKGDPMMFDVYRIEGQSAAIAATPEIAPSPLEADLQRSIEQARQRKAAPPPAPPPPPPPNTGAGVSAPAPAASPAPEGFRTTHSTGNGSSNGHTNGKPNGIAYAASGIPVPPVKIPMDEAVIQAVRMVQRAMKETGEQWADASKQDLVSTVLITAQREGWLTIWRKEAA